MLNGKKSICFICPFQHLLYVGLFVVFELFVSSASGGMSTNTIPFLLNTGVFRTRLSYSNLHRFFHAVIQLLTFLHLRAILARRRLHNIGVDASSEKSNGTTKSGLLSLQEIVLTVSN